MQTVSHNLDDTYRLAAELIHAIPHSATIALHGDLGAGKTAFVQGIALALDINVPVTSPTFTIANQYSGPTPLLHIDLYRLTSVDEVQAFGFEEYLEAAGIAAIEWPERAGELLPADTIHVHIEQGENEDQRTIRFDLPSENATKRAP